MNLYHIYPRHKHHQHDTARGFIVRAKSVTMARQLAAWQCGGEGEQYWMSNYMTVCYPIGEAFTKNNESVILRDYLHG